MPVKELLDKIDHGFTWIIHRREPNQQHIPPQQRIRNFKWLSILALIALILQSGLLFLALFEPVLPYRVSRSAAERLDDPHFVKTLEALTGAHLYSHSRLEVLTNGENYYEAELD
ncbi:MAG TPA: hypothetical protein VES20_22055, partial [Bryobacteraceae bacterium]|nr:hypothetical protein [Bryobacteraceae bacterium]